MNVKELYTLYLQNPSVQTDTRKLKSGDIFFALKGPNFNGNEFAVQALKAGAVFAVIDEEKYALAGKTIYVKDVLKTLQDLAQYHREQLAIPFIAITGSNGKTTTKELIHSVLSKAYRTYTTEGNLNNHIGVPLTILKIAKDAEMAVIEMGANHLHEIEGYCSIALPTHGLITNCGKAHLEGFGSEEGVRKAKGELYDHLRKHQGTAFIMKDYPYLIQMSKGISEVFTYGTSDADIEGVAGSSGPYLNVQFRKGLSGEIQTTLVGSYNLPNVLAAVTAGTYFNVSPEKIKEAIENYVPNNSRSQLISKGSNVIILDAYNANPSSMKAAIGNFAVAEQPKKILVLGAMAELGKESIQEHIELLNEIKLHNWEDVILVGGDFLKISHPYHQFKDSFEAGAWLKEKRTEQSFILIKGSRSMKMEKVLDYL